MLFRSVSQSRYQERDFLTEAILNLGPAIGGAFLGESGQLAAPVALRGARDQYELQRKEHLERAKIQRDDAEKRIKALIDARNSGVASFDRGQQRQLERDKAILAATSGLYKMSADELKSLDQKLMDVNKEIAKERTDKSVDIAKMERSKWEEEQKNKRAEKAAKALKAGEVAGVGDPLPGFTWNKQTPFSQSDLSKLQTAAELAVLQPDHTQTHLRLVFLPVVLVAQFVGIELLVELEARLALAMPTVCRTQEGQTQLLHSAEVAAHFPAFVYLVPHFQILPDLGQ